MSGFNPGLIAKALSAGVTAGLTATITALQDGRIEGWEWAGIAGVVFVAIGAVFQVANLPEGVRRYTKAILAFLVTLAGALGTALLDGQGITTNEALTGILAIISAVTVAWTSNATDSQEVLNDVVDDDEHLFE